MGVSGASEQTTQLGLYKWEDGPDRYNHTELYQNWDNIDLNLLRKRYVISGDEATQIVFGAAGTASLAATALVVKTRTGTVDTQDRFNLAVSGSMSWGLGTANVPDTFLYRSGSAALTTNGSLTVGTLNSGQITSTRASSSDSTFGGKVTGDSNNRIDVTAAGLVTWGSGSGAGDTNLYRNAANELKTDDNLTVGLGSIKLNDYPFYRSGSGTVTAGGNVKITGNLVVDGNLTLSGSAFQGAVNLDTILANNMNIAGNGTIANLIVTTSALFNSAAGDTDFPNGFNINGINITNSASTITVAGAFKANTTVSSTSRTIANSGSATQVAIGSLNGTAAISFGNGEDAHIRRNGSNSLYTPGNFTIGGDMGLTGLNINNPASTTQQLNVNGDIWLPDGGDIYFGNTSKASGAGNRMVLSYASGNGYIDVATGSLNIRNNSLSSMMSLNSAGSATFGGGVTLSTGSRLVLGNGLISGTAQGTGFIYFYDGSGDGQPKSAIRVDARYVNFLHTGSGTSVTATVYGSLTATNGFVGYNGATFSGTITTDTIINNNSVNTATLYATGSIGATGTIQSFDTMYAPAFVVVSTRTKKNVYGETGDEVLDKLKSLPTYYWSWLEGKTDPVHIGPVAEEFNEIFYGKEEETINIAQGMGVALAAIKSLADKVEELEAKLGA